MPNTVRIRVEDPAALLRTGMYGAGAIIRVQSSATETGTFADLTGTGSQPTVPIATATIYTADDPNGITSTWYRVRYENVGATRLSDWLTAFQVSEEGSGLLCQLEDVKQALGISAADTAEDESILEKIGQVSAAIMGYTGRRFARNPSSGTKTFLFDIARTTYALWVPKGIAEMTQLETATQTGGAFSVVLAADWFLDPPETERAEGWPATRVTLSDVGATSSFYPGKRVVRATMAEGWASVPLDIAGIAQRASISGYLSKGSGQAGSAIVGPTGAMTILRGISPEDKATLDWYRSVVVG